MPGDAVALFHLGACLEDMGRTHEAIRVYRQALESDPDCADVYYNLARLYEDLGDSASALRHLQAYRRLTDES